MIFIITLHVIYFINNLALHQFKAQFKNTISTKQV